MDCIGWKMQEYKSITLSSLNHTWLIDLDGTIFEHNSHLYGNDLLLDGVKEFFEKIPKDDYIIIITARKKKYKENTIQNLENNNIRFNLILFDMPIGERILINDIKPKGLKTAIAINVKRNNGLNDIKIKIESI